MRRMHRALLLPWAGGRNYTQRIQALAPIAYWPFADASGATATDESGNGRNGTYSNVTLGAAGIGDDRTAATFNGSTSIVNVFSTSLTNAFNGNLGTITTWAQITSAGVWTDTKFREIVRLAADGSNLFALDKSSTDNGIRFLRLGGGTNKSVTDTSLAGTLNWFHLALTWDTSGNALICYINGAQVGAPQTSIGTYTGSIGGVAVIGDVSLTPSANSNWGGKLAHFAVFASVLTPTQIASLATL